MVKKFAQNASVNQLVFSLYRDLLCFPLLLVAARVFERKLQFPKLAEAPLFIFLGLTGMLGNQLLYIMGIYDSTPNIASVFQPAIPIWTSLLVIIFRIEPLPDLRTLKGWATVLGIGLGTSGAAIVILLRPSSDTAKNMLLGTLFLLGNTLCMGFYIVAQKKYIFTPASRWRDLPVTATAWSYGTGALAMGCASLYYADQPDVFSPPTEIIPPLVYAVLVSSGLCYGLLSWANKRVSSTVVTAFWPVQVFVTVLLSKLVFDDSLVPLQYVGASMIVAGLLAVSYSAMARSPVPAPATTSINGAGGLADLTVAYGAVGSAQVDAGLRPSSGPSGDLISRHAGRHGAGSRAGLVAPDRVPLLSAGVAASSEP